MGLNDLGGGIRAGGLRNLSSIQFSAIPDSAAHRWSISEGSGTVVTNSIGTEDITLSGPSWVSDTWQDTYALDFSDDNASVSNAIAEIDQNNSFSVALTVEYDSISGVGNIVLEQLDSDSVGFTIGSAATFDGVGVRTWDNQSTGTVDISTNTKHRILVTYASDGTTKFYLDTSEKTRTGDPISNSNAAAPLHLGNDEAGAISDSGFDGRIDDIIVYDSVLTASEIQQDYDLQPWTGSSGGSASFSNLSQSSDTVGSLPQGHYSSTVGHNTLSADISGNNLTNAYIEVALNGGNFEPMTVYDKSDLAEIGERSPDGTVLSNISHREAGTVRWEDNSRSTLQLFQGTEGQSTNSGEIRKATSAADPASFSNLTTVIPDDGTKQQDPNVISNNSDNTLYLVYETGTDGANSGSNHGVVEVFESDTLAGDSWTSIGKLGGNSWALNRSFASPTYMVIDGDWFIFGEEHDTNDRDLIGAKGTGPTSFNSQKVLLEVANTPISDKHLNIQAHAHYTKDGNVIGYTNTSISGGGFYSVPIKSDGFDGDGFPTNWTVGDNTQRTVFALTRLFNDYYVYTYSEASDTANINYWKLSGTKDNRSISPTGGSYSWEFYEPATFSNDSIEWRVVAVDSSGNEYRSAINTFSVN